MYYFSLKTVTSSYLNLKDTTPNKFWGFLGVIKCIDTDLLESEITYTISSEKLSIFLDDIFYLGDDKRDYTNNIWYVKLSKYWIQRVKDHFFSFEPNIYSIISFLYKSQPFENELSYNELLLMFARDYHLTSDQINQIFNTEQNFEIQYSNREYKPTELLQSIKSNLNKQSLRPSISMEPDYSVVARPGELSRAPFIQTLYAGQQSLECLMMARFDIEDYYPSKKTFSNIKKTHSGDNINSGKFSDIFYNSGLIFNKSLISRFTNSLLTKPFVILTGLSGSGKTKLAQAFAMWLCGSEDQYKIVPVGADWTNREPLLGFPNALEPESYISPESGVLQLILAAQANPEKPYFLILDEMNLSHVERYFADFLSTMESGEELLLHAGEESWGDVPARIKLPKNLFIVGTVNIDETTYMFSPKVLDRASVIEFRVTAEEMGAYLLQDGKVDLDILKGQGASMEQSFVVLAQNKDLIYSEQSAMNESLIGFFSQLKVAGAEFGYHTASEIRRFAAVAEAMETDWTTDQILDVVIMQKLLPKLHGSRRKLEPVLKTLIGLCIAADAKADDYVQPKADADTSKILYPIALEKLQRMYRGLVDNGFTSYAEA